MEKLSDNYFTIGEFAKLFNLSKQTLFYYERNNILIPAKIEDNGYRYYSMEQYFIFDIIINLRKLDVPLKVIAAYIADRNIEGLQDILRYKQNELRIQIDIMERNIENLQTRINRLEKAKTMQDNYITLEEQPMEYYIATAFPSQPKTMKDDIKLIAKHNYPFITSELIDESLIGYILPYDDIMADKYEHITHIYTKVSHPDEYSDVQQKPAGLYASIVTTDGYHTRYKDRISTLKDFITRNGLTINGPCYIDQLRNYWSTPTPKGYVTKISIPVVYKQEP